MNEIRPATSSKPLIVLFVTLVMNMTLLTVCIICFAGQLTRIVGWVSVAGGEYSLMIDREGWIMQRAAGNWIGAVNGGAPVGFTTYPFDHSTKMSQNLWEILLSDSRPNHLFPGVIHSVMPGFRLYAVRHWVIAVLVGLTWCLWHFGVYRRRIREDSC